MTKPSTEEADESMVEVATSFGIKVAVAALKEAKDQGAFRRLIDFFKKKPRIIILGCTGTGKTNFLESLTKPVVSAIPREDRTLYTEAKNLLVKDKTYRFIDTVGDVQRDADRSLAIREAMAAKGGIAGIVNVVAYGYHEYDLSKKDVFDAHGTVKPSFLELHRQEELKQLAEWVELLGDPLTAHWLITVVNKADLWWDQRGQILEYYNKGDYNKALGGARKLKPRALAYSSAFHRFYGDAPMCGTFDENDHRQTRKRLFDALVKALLTNQGS